MAVNEAAKQNRSTGHSTNVALLNTCDETDKESSQIKFSSFMQNQDPPSIDHAPVQVESTLSQEPLLVGNRGDVRGADLLHWYKPQRCTKDASTAVTESMQQFNQYQYVNFEVKLYSADAIRVDNKTRKMIILFIGSIAVGKMSLINRIRQRPYQQTPQHTINITPTAIGATVECQHYIVQLVDTAGEERFGPLMQSYYKRADGAMLVYDATDLNSFGKVTNWKSTLHEHGKIDDDVKFPIILLGNKADVTGKYINGSEMADDLKMDGFFKTSAKTGEGITDAVKMMISLIHSKCQHKDQFGDWEIITLTNQDDHDQQQKRQHCHKC